MQDDTVTTLTKSSQYMYLRRPYQRTQMKTKQWKMRTRLHDFRQMQAYETTKQEGMIQTRNGRNEVGYRRFNVHDIGLPGDDLQVLFDLAS